MSLPPNLGAQMREVYRRLRRLEALSPSRNEFDPDFVPDWSTTTGTPAVNNGTLTCRYQQVGSFVVLDNMQLKIGSTTAFGAGAGTWRFTLPGAPQHNGSVLPILVFDQSTFARYDGVAVYGLDAAGWWTCTWSTNVSSFHAPITNASPIPWAVDDLLLIYGTYEVA